MIIQLHLSNINIRVEVSQRIKLKYSDIKVLIKRRVRDVQLQRVIESAIIILKSEQYKQYRSGKQSNQLMGNKLKQISYIAKNATSTIGHISNCPNCDQQFPPTTTYQYFDQHVTYCLQNFRPTDQERLRMQRRKKSTGSQGEKGSEQGNLSNNQDYITIQVYIRKTDSTQHESSAQRKSSTSTNSDKQKQMTIEDKKAKQKLVQKHNQQQKNSKQKGGEEKKQKIVHQNSMMEVKTRKAYRWVKSQLTYSQSLLNELSLEQISKQSSAYKILWFYHKLSNYRITWKQGSQQLTFHPQSIVKDSLALINLNMYKQLKLKVVNDIVHDAGGLLREWASMLLKGLIAKYQLFVRNKQGYYVLNPAYCSKSKLNQIVNFNSSNNNNNNNNNNSNNNALSEVNKIEQNPSMLPTYEQLEHVDITKEEYQLYQSYYSNHMSNYKYSQLPNTKQINYNKVTYRDLYKLFARLIAKILIDKVTIPIHFDHILISNFITKPTPNKTATLAKQYKQNLLSIIYTYDKQLCQSLQYLHTLHNKLASTAKEQTQNILQQLHALALTFTIPATACMKEHQLKHNGSNIAVDTKDKLKEYIEKSENYYIHQLFANQLSIIKQEFYSVIKPHIFNGLFQCEQFQLLANGVDGECINVNDWQTGTQYRQPYNQQHKVIKYFWNTVHKMNNVEKMRLLKFVTGSQRLPIFGFKNLQTNRGETSHFVIEGVKYDKKKSYLPKAHTCFNRLILPIYPSQHVLSQNLMAVVNGSFDGIWGME